MSQKTDQVELRTLTPRHAAVTRFRGNAPEMAVKMPAAYGEVMASLGRRGIPAQGPAVARYRQLEGDEFEVEAGFYVAQHVADDANVVCIELPGGEALVMTHLGPYETLADAYEAIQSFARNTGREVADLMWDEYWSDPSTPPSEIRTDVIWPTKAG